MIGTSIYVWIRHQDRPELARPATLIIFLVVIQVTLGALTVISRRDVLINSLHVVVGALVLTTSLVLTLRSWRNQFADGRLQIADSMEQPIRVPQSAIRNESAIRDGGRA